MKWKSDNGVKWYARMPDKPALRIGIDATYMAKRIVAWNRQRSIWKSAPKPEDFGLFNLLNEKFEIRIDLVLLFGAQHVKLFGFRLLSELDDFELFLIEQGFRYEYIEKTDGSKEIDIDSCYQFIFKEKSTQFQLAIESKDGVHITGFYFHNDNGYEDEDQRLNTIADMHDFFMKDKRVMTKKIKSEKGCHNFIQDYIAPYEAARIQDDRFYIVTSEEYKKFPKYRWPSVKSGWILFPVLALIYFGPAIYSLISDKAETSANGLFEPVNQTDNVFICTGPQAKSYHKDVNCYGLQSCSVEIEKIPLDQAKDEGRKPCRYCCK